MKVEISASALAGVLTALQECEHEIREEIASHADDCPAGLSLASALRWAQRQHAGYELVISLAEVEGWDK